MKTTVNINLGGYSFHIDEDAFEKLKRYLDDIADALADEENNKEIIADIESRIAELFRQCLGPSKQVINVADVEKVIAILGSPEDIGGGNKENQHRSKANTGTRKLYRDSKNRYLGGVCAGLGVYFNVPALVFRLLFVVFVFAGGLGVFAYLLLWLVVPEAKTTSQIIEMEGRPVNIENIIEFVKQEFETVKKKMNL